MTRLTRHLYRLLTRFGWVGLVLAVIVAIGTLHSAAQEASTTPPQVTKIEIGSPTSTTAILYITVDRAAWLKVNYGTSTGYNVVAPPEADSYIVYAGPGTQPVTFENLQAATIYHYQITVQDPNNAALKSTTEDRTFTTTSSGGGSSGSGLVISKVKTDCDNDHCVVSYLTSFAAKVELRWDLNYHDTFEAYSQSAIEPGYLDGSRALLAGTHLKIPPDLTFNTTYHYRLHAVDSSGNEFTTGDFSFLTAFNESDHVFSTGQCFTESGEPVLIGGCSSDHLYCAPGGHLIQDCRMMCGYVCPEKATCMASGNCFGDPPSKSSYQCNKSECYDPNGKFISPAVMNCYASWLKCTANTILKVRKDRACDLWLSCSTAIQTQPQAGQASEDLCLSLGACNQLGNDGRCKNYLPNGQCSNDPLRFCKSDLDCLNTGVCTRPKIEEPTINLADVTYQTPAEISKIANLSGNIIAGVDWRSINGLPTIQGNLPWNVMPQIGNATFLKNGDLEYYTPATTQHFRVVPLGTENPAVITADFEDKNNNSNHILIVDPQQDPTNPIKFIEYSGVATDQFTTIANEFYSASVRLRSKTQQSYKLRLQFGYNGYEDFHSKDITVTGVWQYFSLGPTSILFGKTRFAVVCADDTNCGSFELDDLQVRPILQVNDNPEFTQSSCRLYPKADAPSCNYVDTNGIEYRGWRGYCLEYDSITGTCLSWWPVDLIRGEENIISSEATAGYTDRQPLYMCAEADGSAAVDLALTGGNNPDDGIKFYAEGSPDNNVAFPCPEGHVCHQNNWLNLQSYKIRWQDVDHVNVRFKINAVDWYQSAFADLFLPDNGRLDAAGIISPTIMTYSADLYASPGVDKEFSGTPSYFSTLKYQEQENTEWQGNSWLQWIKECSSGAEGGGNNNGAGIRVWTNSNESSGLLSYVTLCAFDDSQDKFQVDLVGLSVFYKPYCSVIAKVVDDQENKAWAGRTLKRSTYNVPSLKYRYGSDFAPFGGAVTPENIDPDQWQTADPLFVQSPDTSQFQSVGVQSQVRAGQPYICRGDTCRAHCDQYSGLKAGQACYTSSDCVDEENVKNGLCIGTGICAKYDPTSRTFIAKTPRQSCTDAEPAEQQCGYNNSGYVCVGGFGLTVGVTQSYDNLQGYSSADNTHVTQSRLQRLFASSYGLWIWDAASRKYIDHSTYTPWSPPKEICWPLPAGFTGDNWTSPTNRISLYRPEFPGDYCAIPPNIVDNPNDDKDGPVFLSGEKTVELKGSGDVAIKVNTNADIEQLPLKDLTIDWGDGELSYPPIPGAPRTDSNNPLVFKKSYIYDSSKCTLEEGFCVYRIKLQLKDNWGWCSDATRSGTYLTSSYQPDFGINMVINDTNKDIPCNSDHNQWYNPNLTVKVTP